MQTKFLQSTTVAVYAWWDITPFRNLAISEYKYFQLVATLLDITFPPCLTKVFVVVHHVSTTNSNHMRSITLRVIHTPRVMRQHGLTSTFFITNSNVRKTYFTCPSHANSAYFLINIMYHEAVHQHFYLMHK